MTSKRTVVAVAALGVILLVVSSTQEWVSGVVRDAVLADAQVSLKGSKAAPACIGAAFVGAAAVLAALTTGRIARWFSAALVPLSGLLALGDAIKLIRDPAATVRDRAATAAGHTGGLHISVQLSPWVWVGVLGAVVLTVAGVLCLAGVRRWSGLSSSYDAPTGKKAPVVSDWDRLSAGDDPTSDDQEQG